MDDKNDFYYYVPKLCEENRILLIEREKYFDPANYPTNNSFAIQTTIHNILELTEHFILIWMILLLIDQSKKDNGFLNMATLILFMQIVYGTQSFPWFKSFKSYYIPPNL